MGLKWITLNGRGLRKFWKRSVIFARLLDFGVDIIFLQETHVTNKREAEAYMKDIWSGKHYWSFGTNNARGVGTLIAKDLDYTFLKHTYDFEGRTCVVDIKMGDKNYRLINVYAPNDYRERKEYIKNLDIYLINNFDFIAGGDWNFVENLGLDKMGGNLQRGNIGCSEMTRLKDDFFLKEAFRSKYPNRKEYTWREGPIHCRLDRFYVSEHLMGWVKEVKHVYCTVSDHYFVILEFKDIDSNTGKFGPGYWKHNVSVYERPEFIMDLTNLWNNNLSLDPFSDDFWWEQCKIEFKKLIIKHSRRISDRKKRQIEQLEKAAQSFVQLLASTNDENETNTYKGFLNKIKSELNDLLTERFKGSMIRSRAQILEQGEKPSRYFLQLEKKIAKSKLITEVRVNGNQYFDAPNIIREVRNFWQDIFTKGETDDDAARYFLQDAGLPRVPPDLVEHCEGPLTMREALESISSMKSGKSPGSDGLGSEFYRKFFYLFGEKFVAMINLCFLNGQLTESQRLSLITLLCKDKIEHFLPINWRPISLINVDAKIVSKSMCNRLKKVLPYIIAIDQTCSVEGRSISDNIHLLRNVFDYIEDKNIGCAWLNFDQFKAFDRVEHAWLMQVLEAFGFGPDFLQWVKVLYTNLKSSVIVNGHISLEFDFARGVRQGCPFAPLLYVLCIEPFSNRIRRNPNIKGLSLPGDDRECKLTQYADDSTLILIDDNSARVSFDLFELYARASGSELNRGKTKGMWLGRFKDRADTPFGIEWIPQKRLLGIIFGYGDLKQANWGKVFSSFCLVLHENMCRNTSFYGRALVANSLAVSKIVFAAQHIILPKDFCDRFTGKLFDFIWKRKIGKRRWEPIKRETMCAPAKYGGINAVHIELKCKALLIKHILRLIAHSFSDQETPKWTAFAIYWIGFGLREYNEEFSSNLRPHCMDFRPQFYDKAYTFFQSYVRDFPLTSPYHYYRPVKQIYFELLTQTAIPPRVSTITYYPQFHHIDFKMVWQSCHLNFLDPELKDIRFKIAHRFLPLYAILRQRNIRLDGTNCVLCWPRTIVPETLDHFTLKCPSVIKVWDWVVPKLFALCNHRLKITRDEIVFCQFPKNMPVICKDILIFFVSLVIYSAWIHRHAIRFCGANSRNENSVLELFKTKLKFRIRTDFFRFNQDQFSNYWAKNEIFCRTYQDGTKLEFLF